MEENDCGTMSHELRKRLFSMSASFYTLPDRVFLNRNVSLRTKLSVYESVVMANGLYGCSSWNITANQMKLFDAWKFRHLKLIMGYKWSDRKAYTFLP